MGFYCGIDLGAKSSQVAVLDEKARVVMNRKFSNDLGCFLDALKPYRRGLQVVVESTFNWYWLVDGLQDDGLDVRLAHTYGIRLISKAKVKTDRRDAVNLARLLRLGEVPEGYIYPKEYRPMRDLIRKRGRLVQMRAREIVQLRMLLYRQGIWDHSQTEIRKADEEDLERWFEDPHIRLVAGQELDRIFVFGQQIEELEDEMRQAGHGQSGYQRLLEVPGLGPILAMVVYYEAGQIHRFRSARHFSSYCRLVPGVAESSGVQRRGRGTKQGNPYLKSAFTQAAVHARQHHPKIQRCYEKHLRRHAGSGGKVVANCIVAHKLALASYYVLRDRRDYREKLIFGA